MVPNAAMGCYRRYGLREQETPELKKKINSFHTMRVLPMDHLDDRLSELIEFQLVQLLGQH